ncbi:hypothetical protein LguiB_022627 [Lonicera macranthoides]
MNTTLVPNYQSLPTLEATFMAYFLSHILRVSVEVLYVFEKMGEEEKDTKPKQAQVCFLKFHIGEE